MTDISEVVSVTVTIQDAVPAVANFGTMAVFVADGPGAAGTWQGTYDNTASGLAAMVAAGFSVNGSAYNKVTAASSQNPKTAKVKIYKRAVPNTHTVSVTVTKVTPGFKQSVDVSCGGLAFTTVSYINGASETTTTIATALELLIEAVTGISSTSAVAVISVTTDVVGDRIFFRNCVRELTVLDTSADAGIATDLAVALGIDPDFFGFTIDGTGTLEIQAAATFAEANSRMFIALTQDSIVVTSATTDVASVLQAASRVFSGVMFSRDTKAAGATALMSRQFSRDPGSSSYANKQLSGPAADALTSTELAFLEGKNGIPFVNIKGLSATLKGTAAGGRFLDITHGVEWLKARIGEAIYFVIANTEKVDFTTIGIGMIEAAVRGVMASAESAGFLASGWTVDAPALADVSVSDKANRLLQNFGFNATLKGAIHKVIVNGTIKV